MEEKKTKKKVDMVTVISVILVTTIICLFNSWLYYNKRIENIKKNNEVKSRVLKTTIEQLNKKNQDLQLTLDKLNADVQKALEENQ
ncbi:MAG: hypothetical protein JXR69_07805 [Candidatus Delongbacteria bacterium]|nr:hypothetical protein [Candidatus Delongbacteria bacterium]